MFEALKAINQKLVGLVITLCSEAALLPKLPVYEPESEMIGIWWESWFMVSCFLHVNPIILNDNPQ